MFVCADCLTKEKFKDFGKSILPISRGPCEECGKVADCHEVYLHDQ